MKFRFVVDAAFALLYVGSTSVFSTNLVLGNLAWDSIIERYEGSTKTDRCAAYFSTVANRPEQAQTDGPAEQSALGAIQTTVSV